MFIFWGLGSKASRTGKAFTFWADSEALFCKSHTMFAESSGGDAFVGSANFWKRMPL